MRNILKLFAVFVLSFTVTNWAIAGFPPVRIGGLLQALKTKFTLLFPNNSVVMKGGVKAYVDTGNKSHLYDGDFEGDSVATEWSVTNATATLVDTERVNGKQHLNLAVAAAIPSINQDQNITVGGSFVASCWIKTDQIDVQFCSRIDGADSVCQNVSADDKWFKYSHQNFTSDTSTSFGVSVKGLSSITGDIKVDNCELEFGEQTQNVAQSEYLGRVEYSGAASCVWSTTSTTFTNYSAVTACNTPTAISGSTIQAPSTKIPAVVLPAGSPAGTYKFISSGFHYKDIATNYGAYRFSDGVNHSQESGIYANTQTIGTVLGEITYNGVLTSDTIINLQARNNSGEIEVYSNIQSPIYSISVYYHPPQSQIVRQSQELNAETANSWHASFTSTHSVVSEDFSGVINCVNNGTGDVLCTWPSQTLTQAPIVECDAFNDPLVSDAMTCTTREVTTTQARLRLYDANASGFRDVGYKITVNKASADFNKSQIVYGQFEQIKSGDTPIVRAQGNANQAIGGTTDLPFIELVDNFSAWDGDSFTVPSGQGGYYFFSGSVFLSGTGSTAGIYIAVNNVREQIFGFTGNSVTIHPFSGVIQANEGDVLSLRASAGSGLSNNADFHHLHIQKIPDIESLVKNLNDNKNVKCQTKILSANTAAIGVLSDLTFTGLTIGKKYSAMLKQFTQWTSTGQAVHIIEMEYGDGTAIDLGQTGGSHNNSNTVRMVTINIPLFQAQQSTIQFNQIAATISRSIGTGVQSGSTYAVICELPDNYIETSEF